MVYKLQRLEKSFTKQNQLKKESKEMNSKVRAPRLQETHVFVTQKSKSTKMELKTTWNPSKERWKKKWNEKKKHGKRIRKQEILNMESFKRDERRRNMEKSENKKFKTGRQISLTSTTHWRLQRRLHKEALIFNHAKETLEEDAPRKEEEDEEDRPI
jgi:hypothetical protein